MVLDLVGGDTFAESLRAVGRPGRVVALANVALTPSTIDTRDFYPRNVHIHGFQITDLIRRATRARSARAARPPWTAGGSRCRSTPPSSSRTLPVRTTNWSPGPPAGQGDPHGVSRGAWLGMIEE